MLQHSARDHAFDYRFVLGDRWPHGADRDARLAALEDEQGLRGDLTLLRGVRDGDKGHLAEKTLRWFVHAAGAFPSALYLSKCDTDTFVVVPRMLVILKRLPINATAELLVLGNHQWASAEWPRPRASIAADVGTPKAWHGPCRPQRAPRPAPCLQDYCS